MKTYTRRRNRKVATKRRNTKKNFQRGGGFIKNQLNMLKNSAINASYKYKKAKTQTTNSSQISPFPNTHHENPLFNNTHNNPMEINPQQTNSIEINSAQHTKLLFKEFLLAYISNLNFGKQISLDNFYNNLSLMYKLLNSAPIDGITDKETLLRIYKRSFNDQYNNILKQKQNLATIRPENTELHYLKMHGKVIFDRVLMRVPDNVILVFLTPLNRYGFCKPYLYNSDLFNKLKNTEFRDKLLKNIFCLDKHVKDVSLNAIGNYKDALNNALVLYPNQSYLDLNISYDMRETEKNSIFSSLFGVFKFTSDNSNIENILLGKKTYSSYLSDHLNFNKSDKFQYVFVDVCRNLDQCNQICEDAFIYENYMYYFNTIMSNCKIAIKSDLPLTYFGKLDFTHDLKNLQPDLLVKIKTKFKKLFYESFPETFSEIIQEIINLINKKEYIIHQKCNPKLLSVIINQNEFKLLLDKLLVLDEKYYYTTQLYCEFTTLILQNFITKILLEYLLFEAFGYVPYSMQQKNIQKIRPDDVNKYFKNNPRKYFKLISILQKLKKELDNFIKKLKETLIQSPDKTDLFPNNLAHIKKTQQKSRLGHEGRNSIKNMSNYSSQIIKSSSTIVNSVNHPDIIHPDTMHQYVYKVYNLIKNEPIFKEVDTYLQQQPIM